MKKFLFTALALFLVSIQARGHEGSLSLVLSTKQGQPGDHIEVRIAGTGEGELVDLTLLGALSTYPLGEVRSGNPPADFQTEVTIPEGIKPGSYLLKAKAGNESFSAPLRIVGGIESLKNRESRDTASGAEGREHLAHSPQSLGEHRLLLQPLQLDRQTSSGEKVVIWGLIAVSGIVGSLLWYRS